MMSTVKKLSEYYNDSGREATVYKNLEEDHFYLVSVKNDSGTSFVSNFDTVDDAEDFAESWVLDA